MNEPKPTGVATVDLGPDDLEPEVGLDPDDGHHCVTFKVADGDVEVWLEPNDARYVASQLIRAADAADAKNEVSDG